MVSINDISMNEKIYVDDFLVDLIPNFINNKKEDLQLLNTAVENRDFESVRKIGHNWKGVCSSYGFVRLGEVGKQFEILAEKKDAESLKSLLNILPNYLDSVQIEARAESEMDNIHKSL